MEKCSEERLALALKALSVMRHDVRNLLASVTIMADRMEQAGDERLAKAAPMLITSMERTVALGVRAGQLVELEPAAPSPISLMELTALIDDDAADVLFEGSPDGAVMANEDQLAIVLNELVANAAVAGQSVVLRAAQSGDRIEIRVIDDGPGIPDYAQDDLFTAFKGAKRRDGSGLGLPIAARLAALNDGRLELERTGEGGTVFLLTLPAG